ncbi:hypothetical protein ACO2EZ_02030 [Staphylococcus epidermidis]
MEKVKSYLKDIQNNEKYQKDIEFLEKKSNGREDRKFILDIFFFIDNSLDFNLYYIFF